MTNRPGILVLTACSMLFLGACEGRPKTVNLREPQKGMEMGYRTTVETPFYELNVEKCLLR